MTGEAKDEVERMIRAGERPRALQYLQTTFNISYEDAALLVEAVEKETGMQPPAAPPRPAGNLAEPLRGEVAALLKAGRKLEAVQLVRKRLHLGLRESLVMVGPVAKEVDPRYVSFNATGCLQLVSKGVGVFLMIVSLLFLVAAAIIYFVRENSLANSDRVTGTVTEMRSLGSGESAPVVQFELNGNKRSYESTYYRAPPDFAVGETVSLFVNRDDPEDITLDTFTDRYALIVGLAVPGAFILLVSFVFLYFGRRKF